MPKPRKLVKTLEQLDKLKINELPNKPASPRDDLQKEWLDIQYLLDGGALISTEEINKAVERQCEIEAIMDEMDW